MGEPRDTVVSVSFDLMSIRIGDMWRMSHYMEAIDLLLAGDEDEDEAEEGDDTIKAVERDTNPTLDKSGSSLPTGLADFGHGKRHRGATGSLARNERETDQTSPTKREKSPSSLVPDLKKVKAEAD